MFLALVSIGIWTSGGITASAHEPCYEEHHHHQQAVYSVYAGYPNQGAYAAYANYNAYPNYAVRYSAYTPTYAGYGVIQAPVVPQYYPAPVYQQVIPTRVIEQPRTTFYYRGRGLSVGFGY